MATRFIMSIDSHTHDAIQKIKTRITKPSPQYVDVIIRRWQAHTGQQAVRLNDGINFNTLQ